MTRVGFGELQLNQKKKFLFQINIGVAFIN
jgi:hypothetical protein